MIILMKNIENQIHDTIPSTIPETKGLIRKSKRYMIDNPFILIREPVEMNKLILSHFFYKKIFILINSANGRTT